MTVAHDRLTKTNWYNVDSGAKKGQTFLCEKQYKGKWLMRSFLGKKKKKVIRTWPGRTKSKPYHRTEEQKPFSRLMGLE